MGKQEKSTDASTTDVQGTDEEKKKYKKREFMHRFKLGSHYRMERFSITVSVLSVCLLFFSLAGWTNTRLAESAQLSTQAMYSTDFTFSLSEQAGTVQNIFRSSNDKRGFILLKMQNTADLSVDAKAYELFLTGVDDGVQQEPNASFFVFGSSGYMGIELYDERGLPSEVWEFTMRANSDLYETAPLSEEEIEALEDPSFGEHDQTRFYANVGAKEAVEMGVLDEQLEPVQLYYALVGRHDEDAIFDRIDQQTADLNRLISRHNEYANRLVELGFQAPPMPSFMDGDYINEDGVFSPRTNVGGYHDIAYYGRRVTDGFVNQVVGDVSEFREYMADKRAEYTQAQSSTADNREVIPRIDELVRDDGYRIDLRSINQGESTSNELSARDAMNTLDRTWREYLTVKRDLQITTMRDLLLLDADIRTQGNAFSTHTGEDFLTIW